MGWNVGHRGESLPRRFFIQCALNGESEEDSVDMEDEDQIGSSSEGLCLDDIFRFAPAPRDALRHFAIDCGDSDFGDEANGEDLEDLFSFDLERVAEALKNGANSQQLEEIIEEAMADALQQRLAVDAATESSVDVDAAETFPDDSLSTSSGRSTPPMTDTFSGRLTLSNNSFSKTPPREKLTGLIKATITGVPKSPRAPFSPRDTIYWTPWKRAEVNVMESIAQKVVRLSQVAAVPSQGAGALCVERQAHESQGANKLALRKPLGASVELVEKAIVAARLRHRKSVLHALEQMTNMSRKTAREHDRTLIGCVAVRRTHAERKSLSPAELKVQRAIADAYAQRAQKVARGLTLSRGSKRLSALQGCTRGTSCSEPRCLTSANVPIEASPRRGSLRWRMAWHYGRWRMAASDS